MNNKDEALRIAFKAFRRLSNGETFSSSDFRTLADLCALALPMKYRFTKAELAALDTRFTGQAQIERSTNAKK